MPEEKKQSVAEKWNLASLVGVAAKFNKVLRDIFDGMGNCISGLQLRKAFNVSASDNNHVQARRIPVAGNSGFRLQFQ
ncbi:MAG: hypothetical protein H6855_06835 [Rhodospirillales bacterium]|nr:hypothetical protein [Rhodospirillales bacterium]